MDEMFQSSMGVFLSWMEAQCNRGPGLEDSANNLFRDYWGYAKGTGFMTQKAFGQALSQVGTPLKRSGQSFYEGIELKSHVRWVDPAYQEQFQRLQQEARGLTPPLEVPKGPVTHGDQMPVGQLEAINDPPVEEPS